MQDFPSFAYSLCQVEEGWRWSVYDEDGVTVEAEGVFIHPKRNGPDDQPDRV